MQHRLPPQTGHAFTVDAGATLRITSPMGEQVADVVAFSRADRREWLSSGRTLDYNASFLLSTGCVLYSNRSTPMFTLGEDSAGRHDFLLAPCSQEMFERLYGVTGHHPSCFENLAIALEPFAIQPDRIPTAFNVFMTVDVDAASGRLTVGVPSCKPGDHLDLRAETDLIVGVTACSAELSNNGTFKPIDVEVR